jgi:hypothetical protein
MSRHYVQVHIATPTIIGLCWREIESGFSFQMDSWLSSIAPELLTDEQRAALAVLPPYLAWQERRSVRRRRVVPVLKAA